MTKYMIVHTMHEGCHNYKTIEEEKSLSMMHFVKINKPKVFLFDDKFQANEFFHDYMNDIDCIDIRCRRGNETEHIDYCTCGIIEMDHLGHPILFYNKVHQIFLVESGANVFMPSKDAKIDINNINLAAKHVHNCRKLSKYQRKVYIELGRVCQECEDGNFQCDTDTDDDDSDYDDIDVQRFGGANKGGCVGGTSCGSGCGNVIQTPPPVVPPVAPTPTVAPTKGVKKETKKGKK